jgi:molybdopterin molybdotransferase
MAGLFVKIGYNLSRMMQFYCRVWVYPYLFRSERMKKLEIHSFEDALEMALGSVEGRQCSEMVMLDQVLGRILATDVKCQKNLPSFDNSAMDGFALRAEDAGQRLRIVSTIFAGDTPKAILEEGCCYKIMTGAQVPADADTIVPIEDCSGVTPSSVVIPQGLKRGSALRKKGEEQTRGAVLMQAGEQLSFSHIAMLSAQGIVAVNVATPLSIAVVSTGDEIREPWQEASEDEIYNANAFGITALLKAHGFVPSYVGSIPDDLEKSIAYIHTLKRYDVVITTGGISMGDADFLEEAFVANGLTPLFHGVNVKPGRPTMMGQMGESFVMAMPGNPMTTLLNILLLSIPILRKLQGDSTPHHPTIQAPISQTLRLKSTRTNLVLGQMREGTFHVIRDNKIGSGMLTPLMESNAVAVFGEGIGEVAAGESVEVVLF